MQVRTVSIKTHQFDRNIFMRGKPSRPHATSHSSTAGAGNLSRRVASHPNQLSLAIPRWIDAISMVTVNHRCKKCVLRFYNTLRTCFFKVFGSSDVFMHVLKNVFFL